MEDAMLPRKPQKAVHSTDPGQSGWWLLAPVGGIAAGIAIPYFATHSAAWTTGGGIIGAAVGAAAGATPQFRDWASTRSHRRQIAESTGVATDINGQPLESLRVHSSDRDITEFVPRDIQHQLVEYLNNGTPVLIEGPSMSGKTRLAIETIRSRWPEVACWFPRDDNDIEKLLSSNQQPAANTVILLDDLDRFLSNQSLTLGLLNQWTNNSCIIIATMMHSQYVKHSDRTNEKVPGWDAVNRFQKLTLTPSLSTEELNAVKLTSYAEQLSQIKSIGLGPLLGCAEAVRTAFADELRNHSWCGTLIKAAADWRRIGLGPASKEQLISFSKAHKGSAQETLEWDGAWKQATTLINNTVPFLRQIGDDLWEVLDIVADEADWIISEHTFKSLQNVTLSTQQARRSTIAMMLYGAPPSSTDTMFQNAIATNPNDITILGDYALFLETVRGDMNQAEQVFRQAITVDPHHANTLGNYALFLQNQKGDTGQAQIIFEQAIEADPHDASNLGDYAVFLHTIINDEDQAEIMYKRAIEADPHNATNLRNYAAFLQYQQHDMDGAEEMYRQAITYESRNTIELTPFTCNSILETAHIETSRTRDMYIVSIEASSSNTSTLGLYANFLETVRGETNQAQRMYIKAIEATPKDTCALVNYAIFLETVCNERDQAEIMFQRAAEVAPSDPYVATNYALFLQFECGEMDQAQAMFEKAVENTSKQSYVFGIYANFLFTVRHDMDRAQEMFQRAIDTNPCDATALSLYARFLFATCGDMGRTQIMFQRAINADPDDASTLGSYALFLHTARGDMDQAQNMYQQAINADPNNARNLGNYAYFLFTVRHDMDQAQDMYQQAINVDPHDASTLGGYALFLHTVRGDMDQAYNMYQQAIAADPNDARNLRTYANFLKNVRGDMDQAQDMYQRAITTDPTNANNFGNYAQILFVRSDDMKAINLADKAISLAGNDEKPLLTECHFYLFAHSPAHHKESGRALKKLLAEGVTTGDWSFEMNLERLRREADPRLELLEAVARTLEDGDMARLDAFEEWRDL